MQEKAGKEDRWRDGGMDRSCWYLFNSTQCFGNYNDFCYINKQNGLTLEGREKVKSIKSHSHAVE